MGAILIACLIGAACQQRDGLPTFPAGGQVTFPDGTPIGPASVIFESKDHAVAATGIVADDGTFVLGTYDDEDGAVAGWHFVTVTPHPPEDVDPDANPKAAPAIDPRYMHPDTSGLEFNVTETGPNHFDIVVTRQRP